MSSAWRRGPLRAFATQTAIVTMIGLGLAAPAAATEDKSRGDDRKAAAQTQSKDRAEDSESVEAKSEAKSKGGNEKSSKGGSEKSSSSNARGSANDDRHEPKGEQPVSKADRNSGGANGQCSDTSEDEGYFCGTERDKPSGNGEGDGQAKGKPWQAHRGKADNKNPRGQSENDHNNGYECDGNKGIAKGNPAHTSCEGEGETEEPKNPGKPEEPNKPGKPEEPGKPENPGTGGNGGGTPGGGTPNVSIPPVVGGVEVKVPSTTPVVKGVETLVPRAAVEGKAAVPNAVAAGAAALPATGATSMTSALATAALGLIAAGGALLARRRLSLR